MNPTVYVPVERLYFLTYSLMWGFLIYIIIKYVFYSGEVPVQLFLTFENEVGFFF